MERTALVPVMAVSIVNGIFSPYVLAIFVLHPVWYPGWLPAWAELVYMMSALILSTLTIMVAGVPTALYERLAPNASAHAARVIWLAGAAILTLPAIPNVLRALGLSVE